MSDQPYASMGEMFAHAFTADVVSANQFLDLDGKPFFSSSGLNLGADTVTNLGALNVAANSITLSAGSTGTQPTSVRFAYMDNGVPKYAELVHDPMNVFDFKLDGNYAPVRMRELKLEATDALGNWMGEDGEFSVHSEKGNLVISHNQDGVFMVFAPPSGGMLSGMSPMTNIISVSKPILMASTSIFTGLLDARNANVLLPPSALGSLAMTKDGDDTLNGVKTFNVAPVFASGIIVGTTAISNETLLQSLSSTNSVSVDSAQTISGVKTFSAAPILSAGIQVGSTAIPNASILQLVGVTGDIQGQLNQLAQGVAAATASEVTVSTAQTISGVKTFSAAPILSAGINTGSTSISSSALEYLNGVTGAIQSQLAACASLTSNNSWSGSNSFNSNFSAGNGSFLTATAEKFSVNPFTGNFGGYGGMVNLTFQATATTLQFKVNTGKDWYTAFITGRNVLTANVVYDFSMQLTGTCTNVAGSACTVSIRNNNTYTNIWTSGSVNPFTGVVTLTGTITCPDPSSVQLRSWVTGPAGDDRDDNTFLQFTNISFVPRTSTPYVTTTSRVRHNNSSGAPALTVLDDTSPLEGNGVLKVYSQPPEAYNSRAQEAISCYASVDEGIVFSFYNTANQPRGYVMGMNSYSLSFLTSSDRRLKENVHQITDALSIVKNLKPVHFQWKDLNEYDFGFIAQEVYEVLPHMRPSVKASVVECTCTREQMVVGVLCAHCASQNNEPVATDGRPVYYSLDYSKFTPYLCRAIQEQQEQIDQLKAMVEAMKST